MIKLHICFPLIEGSAGGGNQFLRSLRQFCIDWQYYSAAPKNANIILFNSHHAFSQVMRLKLRFPRLIFVHRVDGPMRLYNSLNDPRDLITYAANQAFADGTIFQSNWSRHVNYQLGMGKTPFETTILNAADPSVFKKRSDTPLFSEKKFRLITTSWSAHWNKGFDVYKWLDEHLDFSIYEMTFIGNSPVKFKNIKQVGAVDRGHLAVELGRHDIFVTASQKDPCSNALIEAMQCGLPAIALHDGGHPEIVRNGGLLFHRKEEIPGLIEKIKLNYRTFQNTIHIPTLNETGNAYVSFFNTIREQVENGAYHSKKPSWYGIGKLIWLLIRLKIGVMK